MRVREKTGQVFRKRFFRPSLTCKKSNISKKCKRFAMAELIRYDVCDRVATVTLHRPDKRNVLNHRLVAEPKGALAEAAAEAAVRVVVLTGAAKVFSAGADLAALEALQAATPMLNAAENHPVATWAGAVPITTVFDTLFGPKTGVFSLYSANPCSDRLHL